MTEIVVRIVCYAAGGTCFSFLLGLFVARFIAVGQGELIKYPEDGPEGEG